MRQLIEPIRRSVAAVKRWTDQLSAQVLSRVSGQGLVEYALILVLIMVVCVGILTVTGRTISQVWYDQIIQALP